MACTFACTYVCEVRYMYMYGYKVKKLEVKVHLQYVQVDKNSFIALYLKR